MVIGTGIDIIEVERVKKAAAKPAFLKMVFTPAEQAYFERFNFEPQTIAGTFAAKEATAKALSVGFRGIFKKVLILMLVGVAHIVDLHVVRSGEALRSAVICFYLSNEGVSVLENAGHLGLPIPEKLKAILAQLHDRIEEADETEDGGE